MTLHMLCSRCGMKNEPSRLFCAACGVKLDLESGRWRSSASRGRWLLRIVQVLLLAAMALLLWPVRPQGAAGGEAEALEFNGKIKILSAALERGILIVQPISEAEVNGYLAEILKRNPDLSRSERLGRLGIGELNLQFQPDGITVTVIALWGPVRLSYEVTGQPRWQNGRFGLNVRRARWGHLPLAGYASHWMIRRIEVMFSGMERERNVLNRLSRLDLGQGQIRAATGL